MNRVPQQWNGKYTMIGDANWLTGARTTRMAYTGLKHLNVGKHRSHNIEN